MLTSVLFANSAHGLAHDSVLPIRILTSLYPYFITSFSEAP